jgi:hypothetical protein
MTTNKVPAQSIASWLKANLGPRCLAPCTSTDIRALRAAVQIADLWLNSDDRESIAKAFGCVVRDMQDSCWHLAYHATAHVGDWSHRGQLWVQAGLPVIRVPACKFGPQPQPAPVAA